MVNKECRTDSKSINLDGLDLTQITEVINVIVDLFNAGKTAASEIPPELIALGARLKSGMSARDLAADTLVMFETELGIPMGNDVTYGESNSVANAFVAMSKTVVEHIQDNASVQGAIAPAALNITALGGNAGGPITVQGTNTTVGATFATIL